MVLQQPEHAASSPSLEEHLVNWTAGPDVRYVVGPTIYALATAPDARAVQHTPFAGVVLGTTGVLLQGMYSAFRAEGVWFPRGLGSIWG